MKPQKNEDKKQQPSTTQPQQQPKQQDKSSWQNPKKDGGCGSCHK